MTADEDLRCGWHWPIRERWPAQIHYDQVPKERARARNLTTADLVPRFGHDQHGRAPDRPADLDSLKVSQEFGCPRPAWPTCEAPMANAQRHGATLGGALARCTVEADALWRLCAVAVTDGATSSVVATERVARGGTQTASGPAGLWDTASESAGYVGHTRQDPRIDSDSVVKRPNPVPIPQKEVGTGFETMRRYYASERTRVTFESTGMPGPKVEATVALEM
jgi:hypothetical protein